VLSRFLALAAVLLLACASPGAHAYASPLQAENAHRGFAAVQHDRIKELDELSADGAKENSASPYDCTSRQTLGEQFDAGLGLYNQRARYMDPRTGRFSQMDLWQGRRKKPASLNKYAYAENDPVMNSDPSGYLVDTNGTYLAVPALAALEATATVTAQAALRTVVTRALLTLGTALVTATAGVVADKLLPQPKLDPKALVDARVALQTKVDEKRRNKSAVFHYTDFEAAREIATYGVMYTSAPYSGRLGDGFYKPAGAYATDIGPWDPFYTQSELSALFFGGNRNRDVSWFVALDAEMFIRLPQSPREFYMPGVYPGEVDVDVFFMGPNLMRE